MQQIVRRRPPTTTIYADNYGFTINFYQPMIDYLDAKQKGINSQYPHLPWSNERGLKKYSSSKLISNYTSKDIVKYSDEVARNAKIREESCDDYKIINRTPLAVTKSAIGARLGRRLGRSKYETVEERTIRTLEVRANERHLAKVMDDIDNIKARFNAHKDMELSAGLKSAIRGKTANQISAALLADSEKNIKVARDQEEKMIIKAQQRGNIKSKITHRTMHIELMDDRIIDNMNHSVCSKLYDVKRQLQSFNERSTDLLYESRCRRKF